MNIEGVNPVKTGTTDSNFHRFYFHSKKRDRHKVATRVLITQRMMVSMFLMFLCS